MLIKFLLVKGVVFPVVMYGCESWTIKKAEHWRTDAFELWHWRRLLRVPWTARKSKQSCIFIGRTDAETEAPVLWPPDGKGWLISKDPDAGKDWRQEEKEMTEDEMVVLHHWLNGHEFEQAPGDGDGQGSLMCYSPWGHKELDMTKQLNNSNHFAHNHLPQTPVISCRLSNSPQWQFLLLPPAVYSLLRNLKHLWQT